jgi:ferredoxin
LKKKYDPLWEILKEKVSLQGGETRRPVTCPQCHVAMELPGEIGAGTCFRCGLCGALCEVRASLLVADDGTPKILARPAE